MSTSQLTKPIYATTIDKRGSCVCVCVVWGFAKTCKEFNWKIESGESGPWIDYFEKTLKIHRIYMRIYTTHHHQVWPTWGVFLFCLYFFFSLPIRLDLRFDEWLTDWGQEVNATPVPRTSSQYGRYANQMKVKCHGIKSRCPHVCLC